MRHMPSVRAMHALLTEVTEHLAQRRLLPAAVADEVVAGADGQDRAEKFGELVPGKALGAADGDPARSRGSRASASAP